MRRSTKTAAALLAAALLCGSPALGAAEPFLENHVKAFKEAQSSGRPLVIDFYTHWCLPCKQMEETTWKDPEVLALLESFVPLAVDGERIQVLVDRYLVESYPTMVITDPEGRTLLRWVGMKRPAEMREHLAAVSERREELLAWCRDSEGRRATVEALLGLADFAVEQEAPEQAEELFRRALKKKKELDPETAGRARIGLAAALAEQGRCREAGRELERASEASPGALEALLAGARRQVESCEG